jgi:hypothetical protein
MRLFSKTFASCQNTSQWRFEVKNGFEDSAGLQLRGYKVAQLAQRGLCAPYAPHPRGFSLEFKIAAAATTVTVDLAWACRIRIMTLAYNNCAGCSSQLLEFNAVL